MAGGAHELQSTLLRLCVLCATSLQALDPEQAPKETFEHAAAKQDGAKLSEQIHHDILALLQKALKDTTALSLAMRPPKGNGQDTDAPLAGLDEMSIQAASQLLQSLATDTVPKLAFLANLAQKHQVVWVLTEAAANDPSIKEAQKMGAQVVYGDGAKDHKAVEASVGRFFAADVTRAVSEVVELIAQLCQSFMDVHTRTVLERAQARRAGQAPSTRAPAAPTRATSLSLTKRLWTLCDGLADSGQAASHIARLPRNNKEAVTKVWKQSQLMLEDGIQELQDTMEHTDGPDENEEDVVDDMGAQLSQAVTLSDEERRVAQAVLALLQSGMALQKEVRSALFRDERMSVDYDAVGVAVSELAEAQDDLVAATLYGEDAEAAEAADAAEEAADAADATSTLSLRDATAAYVDVCRRLAAFPANPVSVERTEAACDVVTNLL